MSYQLLPSLSQDEYESLKASIAKHGVLSPIEVDEDGEILDGHHRVKICDELGINSWPTVTKRFGSEEEKQAYIYMVNLARRQLSRDQFKEIREQQKKLALLFKQQDKSQEEVAGLLGVEQGTVSKWLCQANISIIPENNTNIDLRLSVSQEQKDDIFQRAQEGQIQAEIAADYKLSQGRVSQIVKEEERKQKKQAKREAKASQPKPKIIIPLIKVGDAAHLALDDETIDVIITSPPYNLGAEKWPMGGQGRESRENGIGYQDAMLEDQYQAWQIECLIEWYRVAKPGTSLFYNHQVRQKEGEMVHPLDWLRSPDNPWLLRQEIIWDRESTHNHCSFLLWPHDERIYWMTKGKPTLPEDGLQEPGKDSEHDKKRSTIWRFHGPEPNTWHPAPFPPELPRRCLKLIGLPNIVVLDPFGGRMTTCQVASELGYRSIGIDINPVYIERAKEENGWTTENET